MGANDVTFTSEQKEAISARTDQILVSAAAGAGKTAVLVERIMTMIIEDRVEITQIVVVTFTKAAATQMRQRIRDRLTQAYQVATIPEDKSYLNKQLLLLPLATISTFHAFCIQILRNYHQYLHISPNFKIGDENELALLKEAAMELTLQQGFELADPLFEELADFFVTGTNLRAFKQVILRIYDHARAFAQPDQFYLKAQQFVESESKIHFLVEAYKTYCLNEVRLWQQELEQCLYLMRGYDKHEVLLAEILKAVTESIDLYESDVDRALKMMHTLTFARWHSIKEKTPRTILAHELFTSIKKRQQKFMQQQYTIADIYEQQQQLAPIVVQLITTVAAFQNHYEQLKSQKDYLDFSDIEQYTIHLLIQYPDVREAIASHITELLVDEYQDTNELQDTILSLLKTKTNRLFMVGDLKQAIYRFRLADPTIFMQKQHDFANKSDGTHTLIMLNKNFRSHSVVLQTANTICQDLFLLDIAYDAKNRLYLGKEIKTDEPPIPTMWHFFTEMTPEQTPIEKTVSEQKAIYIVQQISELLAKGEIGGQKIMAKDIAILSRNKTSALIIAIEQQLDSKGISYSSAVDKGYFDAMEVQTMLAVLKAVENPYDDIALMSYLRSPLTPINHDDLFMIHANKNESKRSCTWEHIEDTIANSDDAALVDKLNESVALLRTFRMKSHILPLPQLLYFIYQTTNYYDFVGTLANGVIRQRNLDILCELAMQKDQIHEVELHRFNLYMQHLEQQKKDFAIGKAIEKDDNCVQIMTIHKSKGLEFPIVFLVDVDRQFNKQDERAPFQMSQDWGIALKYTDVVNKVKYRSWHYDYIVQQQSYDTMSEQLRVLYVALTRGMLQVHIFLDDKADDQGIMTATKIQKLTSYGQALRYSFRQHETKLRDIWHKEVIDIAQIIDSPPTEMSQHSVVPVMNELLCDVNAQQLQPYSNGQLMNYPQKITVTEIKRQMEHTSQTQYLYEKQAQQLEAVWTDVPHFMQSEQKKSPLIIGSLYHMVLEYYNWDQRLTLNEHISVLQSQKIMTAEEGTYIDMTKLQNVIDQIMHEFIDKGYSVVGQEIPFSLQCLASDIYPNESAFTTEKIVVQGKIDLVVQKEHQMVIIDYKTDKLKRHQTLDHLYDKYHKQLTLYTQAMQSSYPELTMHTKIYAILA